MTKKIFKSNILVAAAVLVFGIAITHAIPKISTAAATSMFDLKIFFVTSMTS